MTSRGSSKFISGAGVLAAAQLLSQAAIFIRNVIIVRLLTQVEYGVAQTFGVTLAIITSSMNLQVEQLIVQDKDGSNSKLQDAVQLVVFVRGCLQALLVYLLAPYFAVWFNTPEVAWAYQWLALIPLVRGLSHLDPSRFNREMRYAQSSLVVCVPEIASLIAVCCAAPFIADYRLVLVSISIPPIARIVVSHMAAERAYRWSQNREQLRKAIAFGWPLMLNGFLLLLVAQGDKFLIGSAETVARYARELMDVSLEGIRSFDKVDFAMYSIAASLTFMPQILVGGIVSPLFLPSLSSLHGQTKRYLHTYGSCVRVYSIMGTTLAVLFLVGGTSLTVLVYGERYAGVGGLISWMGIAACSRIVRMAPVLAGFSKADTKISLYANFARSVLIVGYLITIVTGSPLQWICVSLFAGEMVALVVAIWLLSSRHGIPASTCVSSLVFTTAWVLIAAAVADSVELEGVWMPLALTALLVLLVPLSALMTILPRERLREIAGATGHDDAA